MQGESNSISNQKRILETYAKQNGFTNLRWYTDDGFSGANFQRPGFQAMLADIEAGKVGTVIVKDMSRLGRNYLQVGFYTEMLFPQKGVRFIAVNDNVDSANGGMDNDFTPLRNLFNEWLVRDTSKKIKAVKRAKGMSGKPVTSNGRQTMQIYVYDGGVYRLYAPEMLKGAIKRYIEDFNEELVKMSVVNEVYQLLTTDLNYIPMDALNTDESIINFENGLLDLSSGEPILMPHSPDVYSTIQIPCRWTGEATPTPVFDMYMHTLTGGDEAVTKLLLEFMGACLSNIRGYRMKKSLFLVGPGNSGKSQLKALCERLLGRDNFTGIDLKEIEARFGTSSIYGMRLAGSSDMRYMTVSELNAFKLLTGGDCVFAEFKGEQQFKYTYCGLLWFCMNKLPHFGGDTGAWVYDRIMIVHCDNVIENSRQDKMLLEKMYAEREGIVYKCIAALMDVIRNGYRYSEPKCVLDARNTYMEDNSTVITFFHECMVPRKHKDNCTTGKLYDVYRAWCVDNNNGYAETARAFRDKLCEYLGKEYKELTVHTEIGTCYRDYTLSLDAKRQYVRVYGYDSVS